MRVAMLGDMQRSVRHQHAAGPTSSSIGRCGLRPPSRVRSPWPNPHCTCTGPLVVMAQRDSNGPTEQGKRRQMEDELRDPKNFLEYFLPRPLRLAFFGGSAASCFVASLLSAARLIQEPALEANQGTGAQNLLVNLIGLSVFGALLYYDNAAGQQRIQQRQRVREAQIAFGDREVFVNDQGEKMSRLKEVSVWWGDAAGKFQEVASKHGRIELLFLDGVPKETLAYLQAAEPYLAPGAMVVADNAGVFAEGGMKPYLQYVRSSQQYSSRFLESTLEWRDDVPDGMEVSLYQPPGVPTTAGASQEVGEAGAQ